MEEQQIEKIFNDEKYQRVMLMLEDLQKINLEEALKAQMRLILDGVFCASINICTLNDFLEIVKSDKALYLKTKKEMKNFDEFYNGAQKIEDCTNEIINCLYGMVEFI